MTFTRRITAGLFAVLTAASFHAFADNEKITERLASIGLNAESITPSPVEGIKEVQTSQGIFFVSDDAKHFFHGKLYQFDDQGNLTDIVAKRLVKKLNEFEGDMIVFPAKKEKHVVTVFTDISCGYCRKLHNEMADYNDAGITIRYLAFPRGGMQSKTAEAMSQIWCSADNAEAMHLAKTGKPLSDGKDADIQQCRATIEKQYQLGVQMGVTGTPAMVLEDGTMIPGYQPAARLSQTLNAR